MRVVSLLPSATEIVCVLRAGGRLAGISHECDYPPEVVGLPRLTRSRIGTGGTSRDIDRAVRDAIRDALSIYAVDEAALARLAPDVIVTQDLCEVCAVSLDDVRTAVARLAHRERVEIVSLHPMRLGDVMDDVERVAAALDLREAGRRVRAELEGRVQAIAERARRASTRPRVASLEWLDPVMLGGTWMPELIELAGGTAIGAAAGDLAPTVTLADLERLAPDVLVIKPCGFTIERTLEERALVETISRRVPRARIYVTDGNAYFNRPGPRLVESLEIMAACVHPELFADLGAQHAASIVSAS